MEDATRPHALPKKEAEILREPMGVPAGAPVAQRYAKPNKGLQATANSRSEARAEAIGGA